MAECTSNCSTCGKECEERRAESMLASLHEKAKVKKVIGIVSGKGGVGKSLVTSLLAVETNRAGFRTAILDADITGPSIPQCFGLHEIADVKDEALLPVKTASGIQTMSINLLLEDETQPVIFRGPVIAGTVKQFWSEVLWEDVDCMYVDMPPGTGDVPLTVFQSIPVDGIVVVASPQELVGMIVSKAVNMAHAMDIPVLALVENMSYFECPDCHKKHAVFGESHIEEIAKKFGISEVIKLPIDPKLAALCDAGRVEEGNTDWFAPFVTAHVKDIS